MSLEASPVPFGLTGFGFMLTGQLDSETYSVQDISFHNKNYDKTYCVAESKDKTTRCPCDTVFKCMVKSSPLDERRFLMMSEAKSYLSGSITLKYSTMPSLQNWVDFMVWKTKLNNTEYISESVPLSIDQNVYIFEMVSDKLEDVLYLKALKLSANEMQVHNKYNIKIYSNIFDYTDYYFYWSSKMTLFDFQRGYAISLPETMSHISLEKIQDVTRENYPDISLNVVWISGNYKKYSEQSHMCKFTSS